MPSSLPRLAAVVSSFAVAASGCTGSSVSRQVDPDDNHDASPYDANGGRRDGGDERPVVFGAVRVERLRTEYRVNPLGIDTAAPRLDWLLTSTERAQRQTSYQVLVASTRERLEADDGDLWNSGKVLSAQSTQVGYAGAALGSRQTAFWKVRAWDAQDIASPWSDPGTWEMGLLSPSDWRARWVTAALPPRFEAQGLSWIWHAEGAPASQAPQGVRVFRRAFTLPEASVTRAYAIFSVDDGYELYVNGSRVGEAEDWKSFSWFDIGPFLRGGSNVLAVRARNGIESPAGMVGQVQVEQAGQASLVFSTDASWRSSASEPAGFANTDFDDSTWSLAAVAATYGDAPWGTLGFADSGAVQYFRGALTLDRPVRRARLYASALGVYEPSLNGARVGEQYFAPGWTDYTERVQYQTYDVTDALREGENVLGLMLADGWYQGKIGPFGRGQYGPGTTAALAQLEVELDDGSVRVLSTGEGFTVGAGPISLADHIDGEVYDARREVAGWNAPGGAAPAGSHAAVLFPEGAVTARLSAQPDDGVEVTGELVARSVIEQAPGVFVFDLGQNIVGWARLAVRGPAGATLRLRFGELLTPAGALYTDNLREAKAREVYTLRGGGDEVYEPHFTSHGFRYVELSGDVSALEAAPDVSTITGIVAHAATPLTGSFGTSADYLNQLQSNIVWSQRDNFTVVPTDCPQRDERLGWMGDAQIFARTATFNADVATFFTKWLRDVDEAQDVLGAFNDVSPEVPRFSARGTPAWGDAGVIVPYVMYLAYGDARVLEEHYPAMVNWLRFIRRNNGDALWRNARGSDYGDWLNVNEETDKEVLATSFYAHSADLVGRIARILGKNEEAAQHEALFSDIKAAFLTAYVDADGRIRSDTQTAYALALRFQLLPAAQAKRAAEHLVRKLGERGDYLSTGFLGVGHLLPALSSAGRTDLAYKLIENRSYPSWRFELDRGATTIWERWNSIAEDGSLETTVMNSFNHYSFGSVGEWMYETIAGLRLDPRQPGWKHFIVRPELGGGLSEAHASFESPYGVTASAWTLVDGLFTLTVTVPVNSGASVFLPAGGAVERDGEAVSAAADGRYEVGSGNYVFTRQLD